MQRHKIDYGIDLGTTNSAICRMEQGVPKIIKTDQQKDVMPSCVSFNRRRGLSVGDSALNQLKSDKRRATKTWDADTSNTFIEFKRTMATDTLFHSVNMERDFTSEELSAQVLSTLRSYVSDEDVKSVVITVPAKFTVNQKTATLEAARMAGFDDVKLLQEPIAAAMAYGVSSQDKNGIWMVFDLGGGTFDAALLRVYDGIIQVFDTEGDNYLGGKNLDYAIVDNVILPPLTQMYALDNILADPEKKQLLRDALKIYAEEAKNQLSFKTMADVLSNVGDLGVDDNGVEIEVELTLTRAMVDAVCQPIFQKAVDICLDLLRRNNISPENINKLMLVGGPTYSPLLREMLQKHVSANVDTSIDPMTAVAIGAALYASTIDSEFSQQEMSDDTVMLKVGYEPTSIEDNEWVTIVPDSLNDDRRLRIEVIRADGKWTSGKLDIDGRGALLSAALLRSRPNIFNIKVYDTHGNELPCSPASFTILQGTRTGAATLPYNIGIATWSSIKHHDIFRMAHGLEKNKPLPAVGTINNLRTSDDLRPGIIQDMVTIPIYQVDDYEQAEGRQAALYEYVADIIITGADIESPVLRDSLVDITLWVDTSEQMTLEAYFVDTDQRVTKKLDTGKKQSINEAAQQIEVGLIESERRLAELSEGGIDISALRVALDNVKAEAAENPEKKAVLQHLKEVMRRIDRMDTETEWQRVSNRLKSEFDRLEKAQFGFGNTTTALTVEQMRSDMEIILQSNDTTMARETLGQIKNLYLQLTILFQCIGFIDHYNERFDQFKWVDPSAARTLLDDGLRIADQAPTVDNLLPIVRELLHLLPREERDNANRRLR